MKQPNVEVEEIRRRLTQEALADVDAGRVVDHKLVQTWTNNLTAKKKIRVKR